METIYVEIETWDDQTRQDIWSTLGCRVVGIVPDTLRMLDNGASADLTGRIAGEMSTEFVGSIDRDFGMVVDQIRGLGYRVKLAAVVPDRVRAMDIREVWDFLSSDEFWED